MFVTSGFLKSSNEHQLQRQRKTQNHKKEEKDCSPKGLTYYLSKHATLEMVKYFKGFSLIQLKRNYSKHFLYVLGNNKKEYF